MLTVEILCKHTTGNPVQQNAPNYYHQMLFILPRLVTLDGESVSAEAVADAKNFHGIDTKMKEAMSLQYLPHGDQTVPSDVPANFAPLPDFMPGAHEFCKDMSSRQFKTVALFAGCTLLMVDVSYS